MATTTLELEGIIEWPKLFEFNRDFPEFDKTTNGRYTLNVILDDDNVKRLKESGCRKSLKTDPQGRGMVFSPVRKHEDPNGDWAGGPPQVACPDGTAWDVDRDGLIGNGSTARVMIQIYDTPSGKGHRLLAVQVADHVPYVSDAEGSGPSGGVSGFFKDLTADKPKAVSPKQKSKKAAAALSEDEIPF